MANSRAVQDLETAIAQSDDDKVTVSKQTARDLIPDQGTTNDLFRMLVSGLLVLALVSLGGLIFLTADANDATSPDLVLVTFTASLTGLLGLFVKSPSSP